MNAFTSLNQKRTIVFDWLDILAFCVFFVYGIYGAISSQKYPLISHAFSVLLTLMFLVFLILPFKTDKFKRSVSFAWSDILIFIFYIVVVVAVSSYYLVFDLTIDQLFHSYTSIIHSITIVELVDNQVSFGPDISYSSLVRILNISLLFLMGIVIYLLRRRTIASVILLILMFIGFRLFVYLTFQGTDPHPQFRLFPLWLSASVFGVNTFAFRIASVIGLALLMMVVHRRLVGKLPLYNILILVVACATIPVLIHTGTIVEPSIWAALFITFVLLELNFRRIEEVDLLQIAAMLTPFFLMRQTVIAVGGILFVVFIIQYSKAVKNGIKQIFLFSIIFLPLILFFLKSLYWGTPGSVENYTTDPTLVRILNSLTSGDFFNILFASFHWSLLVLFVLSFIPLYKSQWTSSVLNALFFFFLYVIFFSANSEFWGNGRYLAEFIAPFVLLGAIRFALLFQSNAWQVATTFVLIIIALINIYAFNHLSEYSKVITLNYPVVRELETIRSEPVNNFSEVLTIIKEKQAGSSVLFTDRWIYSNLPFIMKDFNVKDCRVQKQLLDSYVVKNGFDPSVISKLKDSLSYIIIDEREKKSIVELTKNGFRDMGLKFENSSYRLFSK